MNMKKIVLNISDGNYEKFRFEALQNKKSVQDVVAERLFEKPFSQDVEEAFNAWIEKSIKQIY